MPGERGQGEQDQVPVGVARESGLRCRGHDTPRRKGSFLRQGVFRSEPRESVAAGSPEREFVSDRPEIFTDQRRGFRTSGRQAAQTRNLRHKGAALGCVIHPRNLPNSRTRTGDESVLWTRVTAGAERGGRVIRTGDHPSRARKRPPAADHTGTRGGGAVGGWSSPGSGTVPSSPAARTARAQVCGRPGPRRTAGWKVLVDGSPHPSGTCPRPSERGRRSPERAVEHARKAVVSCPTRPRPRRGRRCRSEDRSWPRCPGRSDQGEGPPGHWNAGGRVIRSIPHSHGST